MDTVTIKLTYFESARKIRSGDDGINRIVNNVNLRIAPGRHVRGRIRLHDEGDLRNPGRMPNSSGSGGAHYVGNECTYSFKYNSNRVAQPNSKWSILYEKDRSHHAWLYHGLIYVDKDMLSIMAKSRLEADEFRRHFRSRWPEPRWTMISLIYFWPSVRGYRSKSNMEMRAGREMVKNVKIERITAIQERTAPKPQLLTKRPPLCPTRRRRKEPVSQGRRNPK